MPARHLVGLVALFLMSVSAGAQMIPPGQEDLLGAMLGKGAELPDGCALTGGEVEHSVVRATYHCASGDVVVRLSHPAKREPGAITTERFALTAVSGSPSRQLMAALETLIRSRERDFEWSMLSSRAFASAFFHVPLWLLEGLLVALVIVACVSGWRAWSARRPLARRAALEAVVVAAVVVVWLQIRAEPPAHGDTAVDVALARDCIASGGASCLGHAASAIGLLQGQGFTYALALWLSLGLSMHALCFVAACVNGAATGLLHHATSRRFGGVAWVVSAFVAALGVSMTGYPIIWNPSWFLLPFTVAFLAILAAANGAGVWSQVLGGLALAVAAESHVLFGAFVAVAVVIVLVTARRAVIAATVLAASFALGEIMISPVSVGLNAIALRQWLDGHLLPAALVPALFLASIPLQALVRRRLATVNHERRELVAVAVWLLAGAVGLGLVLPWAAARPAQVRYYGAAFPAIAFAGAWLLDAATLRARSGAIEAVSFIVFGAIFVHRIRGADFARADWFMDDGVRVATASGLVASSALDIQLIVRPIPPGPLGEVAAAFVGTPEVPAFPGRIVRVAGFGHPVSMPGWTRIRVARRDILASDIDAWAHPEEAEICPEPATAERCMTLTRADFTGVAVDAGGAMHRVFGLRIPRSAADIAAWERKGAASLRWKIPVRSAGPDETREIFFGDAFGEQIVTVDGTAWTARGGQVVSIGRPPATAAASITVRTPIAGKFEAGVPPMPLELRENEMGLVRDVPPA